MRAWQRCRTDSGALACVAHIASETSAIVAHVPERNAPRLWAKRFLALAGYLLLLVLVPLLPARRVLPADVLWVDVYSSFAVQGAIVALTAAALLAWRRRVLRAAAFILLLAPDAVTELRAALSPGVATVPVARVYTANLGQRAEAVRATSRQLLQHLPDMVWLSEFPDGLSDDVAAEFAAVEEAYPFGLSWPAATGRSLRFLSRFPLRAREVFNADQAPGRPALKLQLDVRGARLVGGTAHALHPTSPWAYAARNEALAWVEENLRGVDSDVVLLGDLNTSAFSPRFAQLVRDVGFECRSPMRCSVGTWPAQVLPLLTPIDHVLAGGSLVVTKRIRGDATGSDHFPVIAEVGRPVSGRVD